MLYVHGVPDSGAMWAPFLDRTGGIAVDLPGFGLSGKRGDLDFSIPGYVHFLDRFLDLLGDDRVRLVVHDWGIAALAWAQAAPERVERLVVINGVPLLRGFRWHPMARVWRTWGAGEIAVGLTTRFILRRVLGRAHADELWPYFDQGTQRAILRLYRWADPERLAEWGAQLSEIDAPALVLWGGRDRYLAPEWAARYAAALGGRADVEVEPGAGHWPWLERPELVQRVTAFLDD